MARLVWSSEAVRILAGLPAPAQEEIFTMSRLLADFPEMCAVRRRGRFRGQRCFVALDWLVYYIVRSDLAAITAIGHARRRGA